MSPVRMHRWTLTSLFPCGCFSPDKNGTRGCIPAVVKRTVGSFSGIRLAFGISLWFLLLKNWMYFSISCFLVTIAKLEKGSF